MEYFLELKALWEKLNSHCHIPMCTCIHRCRCEALRIAQEYRLEDQAIQFLTGLNEHFSIGKTQVFPMDPLPSINQI